MAAGLGLLLAVGCESGTSVVGGPSGDAAVAVDSAPAVTLGRAFADLTETLPGPPFAVFPGRVPTPPQFTVGAFADVDGDGWPEVLLTRLQHAGEDSTSPVAMYRYDRATQRLAARPSPLREDQSVLLGVVDLDGDGRPDAVSQIYNDVLHVAWGATAGFDARTTLVSGLHMENSQMVLYPADLDDDGWLDLLLVKRCSTPECRPVLPLLRVDARRFEGRRDLVPSSIPSWPCAVLSAEFVAGERTHLSVVGDNPDLPQPPMFYRPGSMGSDGHARFEPLNPIEDVLSSPMGVAAGDVDGDGTFDLLVSVNAIVKLFVSRPGRQFRFQQAFREFPSDGGRPMIPWGVALLDVDRDGRLDLVSTHGDDGSSFGKPRAFIGPQHTVIALNQGGYRFVDVTAGSGVERRGQWRSLSVGDLDLDGAPDLIVGGMGEAPRVYRNVLDNGHHSFTLRLHGTTSNHLGAGARVRVFVREGDAPQHHLAGSIGSPLVSSDPLVFVGLGAATTAARVEITWPSGTVQEVRDVESGGVRDVTEPPVLTVDPPGRHAPADGRAEVRIRVAPRRPDGSLADAARVEVRVVAGSAAPVSEATRDAQGWTATLTAPAAPGSTVVEVRVDGVPVRVRPRIWWDAR